MSTDKGAFHEAKTIKSETLCGSEVSTVVLLRPVCAVSELCTAARQFFVLRP